MANLILCRRGLVLGGGVGIVAPAIPTPVVAQTTIEWHRWSRGGVNPNGISMQEVIDNLERTGHYTSDQGRRCRQAVTTERPVREDIKEGDAIEGMHFGPRGQTRMTNVIAAPKPTWETVEMYSWYFEDRTQPKQT